MTAVKIMSYISACSFFFLLIWFFVECILDDCSVKWRIFFCTLIGIVRIAVPACIHNFSIQDVETTVISMVLMWIAYLISTLFFIFAFIAFWCMFDEPDSVIWRMFSGPDGDSVIGGLLSFAVAYCSMWPAAICLYKFGKEWALIKAAIG